MKKPYEAPSFHLIPGVPGVSGDELAAMSDEALEKVLLDNGLLEQKKCYRANPAFLLREIAGEALLMPTGTAMSGRMLPVTETAAFIWRQLETPKTVQDIICAAREAYTDEENVLEAQIHEFIKEHTKSGLVLEGE
ncbi:MAG: PqqD family protein [Clostridia bacterium]|nr:PqqD family protein [Clostridia bacterium]